MPINHPLIEEHSQHLTADLGVFGGPWHPPVRGLNASDHSLQQQWKALNGGSSGMNVYPEVYPNYGSVPSRCIRKW
jgi:hypothetical protein